MSVRSDSYQAPSKLGITLPPEFSVNNSPVVGSGVFTVSKNPEAPYTAWAVAGTTAPPSFMTLLPSHIPNLQNLNGQLGVTQIAASGYTLGLWLSSNGSWGTPLGTSTQFAKESQNITLVNLLTGICDLSKVAALNSITVIVGNKTQVEGIDYVVNYTGGSGGKTRVVLIGVLLSTLFNGTAVYFQYSY